MKRVDAFAGDKTRSGNGELEDIRHLAFSRIRLISESGMPAAIERADDAAGARPGDGMDGDALLLQDVQNGDMGNAARRTA